jgi:hypothetical protein
MTGIAGTLHEDRYTFLIMSRSILLRMRNVLDRFVEEIKHTIYDQQLFFENPLIYEIMWKIL